MRPKKEISLSESGNTLVKAAGTKQGTRMPFVGHKGGIPPTSKLRNIILALPLPSLGPCLMHLAEGFNEGMESM